MKFTIGCLAVASFFLFSQESYAGHSFKGRISCHTFCRDRQGKPTCKSRDEKSQVFEIYEGASPYSRQTVDIFGDGSLLIEASQGYTTAYVELPASHEFEVWFSRPNSQYGPGGYEPFKRQMVLFDLATVSSGSAFRLFDQVRVSDSVGYAAYYCDLEIF